MAAILGIERYVPPYSYGQEEVVGWIRSWLEESGDRNALRLLSVFPASGVETRASVVPIEEVFAPGDFETQNDRYGSIAREAASALATRALDAAGIPPRDVDLVVSVSCTGYMIPALEAYVADALGMGPRLVRLPITESGCAGGVVGLARAADHLTAHPGSVALVLAMEFSSLTFQKWDYSPANIVSTAIFGDGGAAVVLAGDEHPRARARILATESQFFPGTAHLMGFRLRNTGLQIILDKNLTAFLSQNVKGSLESFLARHGLGRRDIRRWVLHPGGRRIIEVLAETLDLAPGDLAPTEAVLSAHGNMSSVTVLFVLDEILRRCAPKAGERAVLGAFGPGFGAEYALLEFVA